MLKYLDTLKNVAIIIQLLEEHHKLLEQHKWAANVCYIAYPLF